MSNNGGDLIVLVLVFLIALIAMLALWYFNINPFTGEF